MPGALLNARMFVFLDTDHWNITVCDSETIQIKPKDNKRNPLLTGLSYTEPHVPTKTTFTTINKLMNYH